MSATLSIFPKFRAFDSNGDPLAGGLLYTYAAGTSTPLATYIDAAGVTQNANPVVLDSSGQANVWLGNDSYKFILKDSGGVTQWTVDDITSLEGLVDVLRSDLVNTNDMAKGDALIGVKLTLTGGTARNQHSKNADFVTPEDFGAVGNGVADDAAALTAAAAACAGTGKVLRGVGNYRIKSTVSLRSVALDFTGATVTVEGATVMLKLGGDSSVTPNPPQSVYKIIKDGGVTSTPTARIMGTKNQTIDVGFCDYLQVYADTDVSTDTSVAYCTWNFGYIQHLEFATNPTPSGSAIQWINENHCYFQRCGKLTFGGTYEHNHNHFYGGTFEGANPTTAITLNRGWDNQFHDCRFETDVTDTVTITLASNTQRNVFVNTYDASEGAYDDTGVIVSDSGQDNLIIDDWALYRHGETIAYTDLNEVVLDTQIGEFIARTTDLQRLYNTDNFGMMCQSDFVPVLAGDYFTWISQAADGSLGKDAECAYRPRISFFNSYLEPVTANANFFISKGSGFTAISSNNATQSSNISGGALVLTAAAITAGVRFVKVAWRNSTPVSAATSKAVMLAVIHHTAESRPYQGVCRRQNNPVGGGGTVVTGQPTKGFAPVGWVCIKSDGSARYFNKYMHQTSTLNAEITGATVIEVAETVNGAGNSIANGDIVGINLDDLTTHWTTVASFVVGTSITLTAGIPSGAAAGKRVVFGRWATC